jgi:hypothetical protein
MGGTDSKCSSGAGDGGPTLPQRSPQAWYLLFNLYLQTLKSDTSAQDCLDRFWSRKEMMAAVQLLPIYPVTHA